MGDARRPDRLTGARVSSDLHPVVVVGAGISGVACARALRLAGLPVRVLERGRVVGGRMASRRLHDRPVDLGASYLTASDPRFTAVVDDWAERGLAHPWTETFTALTPGEPPRRTSGPVRWGTPGGIRSLVEDLATGLGIEHRAVATVEDTRDGLRVDGEPARAVALAMPDAQAARIAGEGLEAVRAALDRTYEPALALAAGWPERRWPADLDGVFVNDHPVLGWLADDGRRRGDGSPVLVAHSTGGFAERHLADPQAAAPAMVAALRDVLDLDRPGGEPAWHHVHRWSLARPLGERHASHLLAPSLVGCCGDGWGPRSKVEGAWLSGTALGEDLAGQLA